MYGKAYKSIIEAMTVRDAIDSAIADAQEIAEELSNWLETLSEHAGDASVLKAKRLKITAETLSAIEELKSELPDGFEELSIAVEQGVKRWQGSGAPSRIARVGNAAQRLRAVQRLCEKRIAEIMEAEESLPLASSPWETWSGWEGQRVRLAVAIGFSNEEYDQLSNLSRELEEIASGWEEAYIPTVRKSISR